jgi:hypothetical protein
VGGFWFASSQSLLAMTASEKDGLPAKWILNTPPDREAIARKHIKQRHRLSPVNIGRAMRIQYLSITSFIRHFAHLKRANTEKA